MKTKDSGSAPLSTHYMPEPNPEWREWRELRAAVEILLCRDFIVGNPFRIEDGPKGDADLKRLRLALQALEEAEYQARKTAK